MGRRAKLRLGSPLPQTRTRLRTPRHNPRHLPLPRLRMPHDRQPLQTTPAKFITASSSPSVSSPTEAPFNPPKSLLSSKLELIKLQALETKSSEPSGPLER